DERRVLVALEDPVAVRARAEAVHHAVLRRVRRARIGIRDDALGTNRRADVGPLEVAEKMIRRVVGTRRRRAVAREIEEDEAVEPCGLGPKSLARGGIPKSDETARLLDAVDRRGADAEDAVAQDA